MDYCLGDGDGAATMWTGTPDWDLDGDGAPEAIRLDFDGDGLADDALVDLDGDGLVDHAVLDLDGDGIPDTYYTDDGSGTWTQAAAGAAGRTALRWMGLDGAEHAGGPFIDFDGDRRVDDRLIDSDGDGWADRVLLGDHSGSLGSYDTAYVDTDGDGRWDVKLVDADGDGAADGATTL